MSTGRLDGGRRRRRPLTCLLGFVRLSFELIILCIIIGNDSVFYKLQPVQSYCAPPPPPP